MRLLLAMPLVLAAACPSTSPRAPCASTATLEGGAAFREQSAARSGSQDLRLQFVVNRTLDERFTATPEIQTNLGEVVDAQVQASTLTVQILLGTRAAVDGEVVLRGTLSGTFVEDLDHCPYQRRFLVSQPDTLSAITVTAVDVAPGL